MPTSTLANPIFEPSTIVPSLVWCSTSAGVMLVARLNGRDVAGISGPWGGRYVLTWWGGISSNHPFEIFDSREDARAAVESFTRDIPIAPRSAFVLQMLQSWDAEEQEVTPIVSEESCQPVEVESAMRRWLRWTKEFLSRRISFHVNDSTTTAC